MKIDNSRPSAFVTAAAVTTASELAKSTEENSHDILCNKFEQVIGLIDYHVTNALSLDHDGPYTEEEIHNAITRLRLRVAHDGG